MNGICKTEGCPKVTSGKSQYCAEHRVIARAKFIEMISAQKEERVARYDKFEAIIAQARDAGQKAFDGCKPTPMLVQQHESVIDDTSPVTEEWTAAGGVCGFASVIVKPGNGSFARWLVKNNLGSDAYYGGVRVALQAKSVGPACQSYERNCAFAHEVADVIEEGLNDPKVRIHVDSRLD